MSTFEDSSIAARFRDAIHREAIKAINERVPLVRYGTVTQIDPDISRVMVLFEGDPAPLPVKLIGISPRGTGQVVQVSGHTGDLYVSGVIGTTRFVDAPTGDLLAPTNFTLTGWFESVIAKWDALSDANFYQLEIADDSGFTVNVRSFETKSSSFTASNLSNGSTYWGRVRQVNNSGGPSDWSPVASAIAEGFESNPTDGFAPEFSPQPVVTGGLGFLSVDWLPVPNDDLVTYVVHLSKSSGFTPWPATEVGRTSGTFFFINKFTDGSSLDPATIYFVRIVALDGDGAAGPSAQGSGSPVLLDAGDVGFPIGGSDGEPPGGSPNVGIVTNGLGFLYVQWTHITNEDRPTYDVHISTTNNFTPTTNTKVGDTVSNWFFIRTVGPGAGGGPLVYGVTYYIKLWARDNDGFALNPGAQGSGISLQVDTPDLAVNAITAASGVIADLAVGTAKIQDASITTLKVADATILEAKIGDLQVSTAKIQEAAISTAKIGDLQVTTGKIDELAVSTAKITNLAVTSGKIQDLAVITAKIGDLQVTTGKIDELAVSTAKITNLAVTSGKIQDLAVTTAKIQDAAITNAKINDLNAVKITAGTINADRIGAGTITGDKIVSQSISTNQLSIRGENAMPDPNFNNQTSVLNHNDGIYLGGDGVTLTYSSRDINGGDVRTGSHALRVANLLDGTSSFYYVSPLGRFSTAMPHGRGLPVTPGEQLYFSAYVGKRGSSPGQGWVRLGWWFYRENGLSAGSGQGSYFNPATVSNDTVPWTFAEYTRTVPAGAVVAYPMFQVSHSLLNLKNVSLLMDDLVIRRRSRTLMIEDQAVDVDRMLHPVQPREHSVAATGFSINTSLGTKVTASLSVDPWANMARVIGYAQVSAQNNSGSTGLLYVRCEIAGVNGTEMYSGALDGASTGMNALYSRFVSSPGSTVLVAARCRTSTGTWSSGTIASTGGITINSRT